MKSSIDNIVWLFLSLTENQSYDLEDMRFTRKGYSSCVLLKIRQSKDERVRAISLEMGGQWI